jgi:hypothetical protein
MLVGTLLAFVGHVLQLGRPGLIATATVCGVACLALVREAGIIDFRLPGIARQTNEAWGKRFGLRPAAILWGLDIGLVFTTYLNYSGVLVLTVAVVLIHQALLGAIVFLGYWIGRVLSVLIAPMFLRADEDGVRLFLTVQARRALLRSAQVAGLCCCITWCLVLMTTSSAM